eukprot:scaffold1441_cov158-Ochromonas_danica.AAC.2
MTRTPEDLNLQHAFFILPGFIKALSMLRTPKPIRFLEDCAALSTSPPHLAAFILHRAGKAHDTILQLRNKSHREASDESGGSRRRSPHIREHNFRTRIEALFREGRYASATSVLEQAH